MLILVHIYFFRESNVMYLATNNLKIVFILSLFAILLAPDSAQAQTALFDSGTNFLTALQNLLSSTWARLIGIIGVIFLGFMAIFGRLRWGIAGAVIGGIILVFGAPAIVDSIAGNI